LIRAVARSDGGHLRRFVRFALAGAVATVLQYALLAALVRAAGMAPVPASCIGFALSAILNYLLNYRFTFRSQRAHGPAAAKFALLAAVGLLINAAVMRVLGGMHVHYLLAQICASAVVLLWNFTGNSQWTFGVEKDSMSAHAASRRRLRSP
jgi:putative flippase GtrA